MLTVCMRTSSGKDTHVSLPDLQSLYVRTAICAQMAVRFCHPSFL